MSRNSFRVARTALTLSLCLAVTPVWACFGWWGRHSELQQWSVTLPYVDASGNLQTDTNGITDTVTSYGIYNTYWGVLFFHARGTVDNFDTNATGTLNFPDPLLTLTNVPPPTVSSGATVIHDNYFVKLPSSGTLSRACYFAVATEP